MALHHHGSTGEFAALMLAFIAVIFFAPLIGVFFGAFSGWVVGWFFSETILGILRQLGIEGVAMWQVGAFLGFVGGFLKTSVSHRKG